MERNWHTLNAIMFGAEDNVLKLWVSNDRVQKWVALKDFIAWNPGAPKLDITHIEDRDDEDACALVKAMYIH